VHDYVTLLERVFLLERVPPWHSNRLSRLVKTPKLHMGDTGIACALLGLDAAQLRQDRAALGPMLETFVYQELRRQASWGVPPDFRGLRKLREAAGDRFASGIVLYDGETTASFGDGFFAVPVRAMWETT
jgi:predicted AAA+ superfamily ATPase